MQRIISSIRGVAVRNILIYWGLMLTVMASIAGAVGVAVSQVSSRNRPGFLDPVSGNLETQPEVRTEIQIERIETERIVYRDLPDDLSSYVTIVEVMTQIGVQPVKELTWAIGRLARELHVERYGVPPRKVDRQKTNSGGSHSFAAYPAEMVDDLKALIRGRAEDEV